WCSPLAALFVLEPVGGEFPSPAVLGNGADDLFRSPRRDLRIDLERDLHRGADQPGEVRDALRPASRPTRGGSRTAALGRAECLAEHLVPGFLHQPQQRSCVAIQERSSGAWAILSDEADGLDPRTLLNSRSTKGARPLFSSSSPLPTRSWRG